MQVVFLEKCPQIRHFSDLSSSEFLRNRLILRSFADRVDALLLLDNYLPKLLGRKNFKEITG